MNTETRDALKTIKEFWSEDKYCRFKLAVDCGGVSIEPTDEYATGWCISGVIEKLMVEKLISPLSDPVQALNEFCRKNYGTSLIGANDYRGYLTVIEAINKVLDS